MSTIFRKRFVKSNVILAYLDTRLFFLIVRIYKKNKKKNWRIRSKGNIQFCSFPGISSVAFWPSERSQREIRSTYDGFYFFFCIPPAKNFSNINLVLIINSNVGFSVASFVRSARRGDENENKVEPYVVFVIIIFFFKHYEFKFITNTNNRNWYYGRHSSFVGNY